MFFLFSFGFDRVKRRESRTTNRDGTDGFAIFSTRIRFSAFKSFPSSGRWYSTNWTWWISYAKQMDIFFIFFFQLDFNGKTENRLFRNLTDYWIQYEICVQNSIPSVPGPGISSGRVTSPLKTGAGQQIDGKILSLGRGKKQFFKNWRKFRNLTPIFTHITSRFVVCVRQKTDNLSGNVLTQTPA